MWPTIARRACSFVWMCMALTAIAATLSATQQIRRPFPEILVDYRTADADAAVREFALWSHEEVVRHARLPPNELADPWTRAAVALLHLEAGLANDTFDDTAPDVRVVRVYNLDDVEIHARTAYQLMAPLTRLAAESADLRLREFCRQWYLTAWNTGRRFEPPVADDPALLLIQGRVEEYWTGPAITAVGGLIGFGVADDEPGGAFKSTSHGPMSLRHATEAERAFRRVLELDPQLAEAHLRLGRLAYLCDRHDDAEQHWQAAASLAARRDDVFSGYLAQMFLGQLLEDQGKRAEATVAYRKALEWLPTGQIAALALARLDAEAGEGATAWTRLNRALRVSATTDRVLLDPWYAYGLHRGPWARGERIHRLRQMLRH